MRIAVLGAGAVGGTFAALLDRAGHEVEVTARGENLAAIREHGLRLDGAWGEHVAHVATGPALSVRCDLAILATKAQDARAALEPNAALLDGVPMLVVQNGLGGLRLAHEMLPASALLGGLALFAASYLAPGAVTVTTALPTIVGVGPGADAALRERVIGELGAAIPLEPTDDLEAAQWTKLLINHVNALPAITGMSVQQVIAHRGLRRLMTASMRETVRIARRVGARFAPAHGVSAGVIRQLSWLPLRAGQLFPLRIARNIGTVPNPGSTLQSIRRGRLTEIDFLNGAIVRAAREQGLPAPVNAALVELVHEVERSRVFLSPEEVMRRIPV